MTAEEKKTEWVVMKGESLIRGNLTLQVSESRTTASFCTEGGAETWSVTRGHNPP